MGLEQQGMSLSPLPLGSRHVELVVFARRFWCDVVLCERRVVRGQLMATSWLATGDVPSDLRRCPPFWYSSGRQPAFSFANRLMTPVSIHAVLRLVRRRVAGLNDELSVHSLERTCHGNDGQGRGAVGSAALAKIGALEAVNSDIMRIRVETLDA